MMGQRLRIGSRASALALWQAKFVADKLTGDRGATHEIIPISTFGDRNRNVALHEHGGKGAFVREIEKALLEGSLDLAVHSLKDMPVCSPPALEIFAYMPRHAPEDCLVLSPRGAARLGTWGHGLGPRTLGKHRLRVATQSLRRSYLLQSLGWEVVGLRGNIGTRLCSLDASDWDGIILARAGLERLAELDVRPSCLLDPTWCVPSASQGIIAVQGRRSDIGLGERVRGTDCAIARRSAETERQVLALLGADCQLPVGVWRDPERDQVHAMVVAASGRAARAVVPARGPHTASQVVAALCADGLERVYAELGLVLPGAGDARCAHP